VFQVYREEGAVKLTKRDVDALICPDGRQDILVSCGEPEGLFVRVTRAGTKCFLFQHREGGKVKRLQLGHLGEVTLEQARRAAQIARAEVRTGRSPVAEMQARRAAVIAAEAERKRVAAAETLTFSVLITKWEAGALQDRREAYRREAVRLLKVNLPTLAPKPAHAIDAAAAGDALDGVAKERGDQVARQTYRVAHAMYGWAIKRRLGLTVNPFSAVSVEGRTEARDRVLDAGELGEVWRATGGMDWPFGPYLRLLLLTLQRRSAVAGMKWAELTPDLAVWNLPAARSKNNQAQVVHLAEPARAILRELPRLMGSDLVFTTNGLRPISGISGAKQRLDGLIMAERAKLAAERGATPAPLVPWTLHDFRRSGATALQRMGVPLEVSDKVLAHITGKIQGPAAVYHRYDFGLERISALDRWAAHVLAAAKDSSATVDLRPQAPRKRGKRAPPAAP
jgi:integrase